MASLDRYKLSSEQWDSDKDPEGFPSFMYTMSAMVRAIAHGNELENFIDRKLDRARGQSVTIPSFLLDDPDFGANPEDAAEAEGAEESTTDTSASVSSGNTTMGSVSLHPAGSSYWALSSECRDLDGMLHSVLKMSIKGSKKVLLECVQFPSYIQAICVLYRHSDISRNDRITRAFDVVDQLSFNGDVTVWQADVVKAVREILDSGASIMHFILTRILKSFKGKLKTIQYRIAQDINSRVIDESTNIFDMVQTYAVDIASVGDSSHNNTTAVVEASTRVCTHCGKTGHLEETCFEKYPHLKSSKQGKGGKGKKWIGKGKPKHCTYCKKAGHTAQECRKQKADGKTRAATGKDTAPAPTGAAGANAVTTNRDQVRDGLAALLKSLHTAGSQNLVMAPQCSPDATPVTRPSSQGGHRGERVGEANHPGPAYGAKVVRPYRSKLSTVTWALMVLVATVLSVCDGMGCAGVALRNVNTTDVTRYVAVENNSTARKICSHVNKRTDTFPGVDHSVVNDMYALTEQDIIDMGPIVLFVGAPPCSDFSKSRLIKPSDDPSAPIKWYEIDPRPGLDGEQGKKFRQLLVIMAWVLKHNPDCEWIIENVWFDDIPGDWDEVCSILGTPIGVETLDYNYTKAYRAYWCGFRHPVVLPKQLTPRNPQQCMLPGRTVHVHVYQGRECVRRPGASWAGDPDHPVAQTRVPVLVDDELFDTPQHLQPVECELLLGHEADVTAAPGVANIDRLRALGNGWDMVVTTMIMAHSQLANLDEHIQCEHSLHSKEACPDQHNVDNPALNSMIQMLEADQADELVSIFMCMDPDDVHTHLHALILHYALMADSDMGSVLDSGAAKHLRRDVRVLDSDNLSPLTGFDGSVQWTLGNGYLPIQVNDVHTGSSVSMDISDCDLMGKALVTNLLSLGKPLRDGWEFHLANRGKECYAITPGGAFQVEVLLGMDNILRLRHSVRSGMKSVPIPAPRLDGKWKPVDSVLALHKRASDATGVCLHEIFNHSGEEKLYRTLGSTVGYKQVRLKLPPCKWCAAAKARQFGLKQKPVAVNCVICDVDSPMEIWEAQAQILLNIDDSPSLDPDPVFDDGTSSDDGTDTDGEADDFTAEVAGRELGVQNVPRFQLDTLRPWELMFVDNKDYPVVVRGGYKTALIFIDYKTRVKSKVDVRSKKHNGKAFSRIVALFGIHKVGYPCRVYSDGCGSMVHVKNAAVRMGIDHAYTPPHMASLNEAEKVADRDWESARTHMLRSRAPDNLFALCVDFVMHVSMRMATTSSRSWKTPYELVRGVQPDVSKLHRWYTAVNVLVPKSKRAALAKKGLHNLRGQPGRFVGFQSLLSSTYAVMLDEDVDHKLPSNTLVHSINVTFDDTNYTAGSAPDAVSDMAHHFHYPGPAVHSRGSAPEEANDDSNLSPQQADPNPLCNWPQPQVVIEPINSELLEPEFYDLDDPQFQDWRYSETSPQSRPRPNYASQFHVNTHPHIVLLTSSEQADNLQGFRKYMQHLEQSRAGFQQYAAVCQILATHATKDINWKQALSGPNANEVIAAYEKELKSLTSTVLTEVFKGDGNWDEAVRLATPGRFLLDIKRSTGSYKARGVKQGFKEDKVNSDGPDFNYYTHVAKFTTLRASLFRYKRGTRRVALKDVATAFLQSEQYEQGKYKYICFKCPLQNKWRYFKQSGPLYGECSAPKHWSDTFASFLKRSGFEPGLNEPAAHLHSTRELLAITYVDDTNMDGSEDDIQWLSDQMENAFKCQDTEWLSPETPIDDLGIDVSMDSEFVYADMSKYIYKCLDALGLTDTKPVSTPIDKPITPDGIPLSPSMAKRFMTGIGMIGWMAMTVRCDISYAHSRISQHQSKPTEAAWNAVKHCFQYLLGTHDLGIRAPIHHDYDSQCTSSEVDPINNNGWELYIDSDFASNDEPQNRRRSQNGYIVLCNGAPIMWSSKASSVAFADERINEAHADTSSGAAEVYAAGNATQDFLHLSHVLSEMGIDFPSPAPIQIDNSAAIVFAKNTAHKSKLKHIDARQEWVKVLRDSSIFKPVHVTSTQNLADLFTKILCAVTFKTLRDRIMHPIPSSQ